MGDASAPITIAHVLEATAGGTRQYLMDACLGLPRERFRQTAVVSLRREPAFQRDVEALRQAGVAVEVVDMGREIHLRDDLRALRELQQYFERHPFDIIHTHSSKAGMLGRLAAWRAGNPAVRVHSPHAFAFVMRVPRMRRLLYLALERLAGRLTDMLVCTCESELKVAVRSRIVPPGRVAVVRIGVDLREFHPEADVREMRAALELPNRHRVVGTVGALVEQKGHEFLVEAAPLVLEQMPHTTFLLIGDGPLREPLEARATELGIGRRMRFLGHRDDVGRVLPALDLFVLPSLWEGLPYALIEAMAVGVPVVGSDIAGIADVIRSRETGWLAPVGSVEGLADAIVLALSREGMSARMAEAARELVVREHGREQMLATLAALYERLVEERAR